MDDDIEDHASDKCCLCCIEEGYARQAYAHYVKYDLKKMEIDIKVPCNKL